MLEEWFNILQDYDFTIIHQPGILNILPDYLSRLFNINFSKEDNNIENNIDLKHKIFHMIINNNSLTIVDNNTLKNKLLLNHHKLGHFGTLFVLASKARFPSFEWSRFCDEHPNSLPVTSRLRGSR